MCDRISRASKKKKDKNLLLGRQNKNPEKESRGKI